MKITRFEDVEAWKEARVLVSMVYESTGKVPFKKDWGLKDQIQRAAVSVMSNIAEGFMSQTNREFIVFLVVYKVTATYLRRRFTLIYTDLISSALIGVNLCQ